MPKRPSSRGTVNLAYTLSAPATNGADYGYGTPRNPDTLSGFLGLGRVGSWTIKDEPCQRIGGGHKGSEVQIFAVFSEWSPCVIHADPDARV
jgi:hypothetical protein